MLIKLWQQEILKQGIHTKRFYNIISEKWLQLCCTNTMIFFLSWAIYKIHATLGLVHCLKWVVCLSIFGVLLRQLKKKKVKSLINWSPCRGLTPSHKYLQSQIPQKKSDVCFPMDWNLYSNTKIKSPWELNWKTPHHNALREKCSQKYTVHPKKYADGSGFVVLDFTHILQSYFTDTGAIIWLPQCQWSNPEGYW